MSKFTKCVHLRDEFNLTQQELADQLGVARNTVARWEVGLQVPPKIVELALEGLRARLLKRAKPHKRRSGRRGRQ